MGVAQSDVSTVLLGASGVAQLRANLGALDLLPRLDAAAVARIEAAVDGAAPRVTPALAFPTISVLEAGPPRLPCTGTDMRATSALDLIGNTPLISLDRIHAGPGRLVASRVLQPGGSVKDRAAKAILLAARADGRLKPGMPVVEMTSGNMGAGLAVACAALGHPLLVTMSAGNNPARPACWKGWAPR